MDDPIGYEQRPGQTIAVRWSGGKGGFSLEGEDNPVITTNILPKEAKMKLSPPKQVTFIIAVVLGLVGLVASFVAIPVLSPYAFWLVFVGLVVLAAGNMMEGM